MGILNILHVVFAADLDPPHSGAVKALMHCSSQPVGWASEEALQPAVSVIMAALHTSSHRRALIPAREAKSISTPSTESPTAERIECQESHGRRKGTDSGQGDEGVAERLGKLVFTPFFLFFSVATAAL